MNPLTIYPKWFKSTRSHLDAARKAMIGSPAISYTKLYALIHGYYAAFAAQPLFPEQRAKPAGPDVAFPALKDLVKLVEANASPSRLSAEVSRIDRELARAGLTREDMTARMDLKQQEQELALAALKEARARFADFMKTQPRPAVEGKPTAAEVEALSAWVGKARQLSMNDVPRLESETAATHAYLAWEEYGSNTFALSPDLTEMLRHTDVGDIRASDIRLPFNSMYIHFGRGGEHPFPGKPDHRLDGAYVSWVSPSPALSGSGLDASSLSIVLTAAAPGPPPAVSSVAEDDSRPLMPVVLNFIEVFDERGEPVQADLTASGCYLEYKSNYGHDHSGRHEIYTTYREATEASGLIDPSGPDAVMKSEFQYVDEGLKLVLNALSYMALDDREERVGYAEPAGERDALRATELRGRQRKQEEDRIARRGYTVVRFLGSHTVRSEGDTGREVRAHWRRGHWRRQRFGHGMLEVKRLWIRPTVVRRDKGEPSLGHLYEVEQREPNQHDNG